MKDMMTYKGYFGSVHYNDEDAMFFGRIEFIRSLISYEGESVATLKESFQEAVEEYLILCQEEGREPEKPFKGSFNVRVGKDLHRKAALYAEAHKTSLNTLITDALREYLVKERLTLSSNF
jgi:predicted HicB family RNase H-like nuclease